MSVWCLFSVLLVNRKQNQLNTVFVILIGSLLACRSSKELDDNVKAKLAQICHVPSSNIINLHDVPNIWHIPLLLRDQKAHEAILNALNLQGVAREPNFKEWIIRTKVHDKFHESVKIAMVGKYTSLSDAYFSVLKALLHASVAHNHKLIVDWVPAEDLEDGTFKENLDAHKVAWGLLKVFILFGDRGVQGKILAAKFARENNVPYLGICLGMQIAVIEFARSILGLLDANSRVWNLVNLVLVVLIGFEDSYGRNYASRFKEN